MKMNPQLSRRLLLGGMALALLAALAWVALRTGPLAPVKVQVTEVTKGRVSPEIFGIGQVEAQRSWMVGPTVAGRVRSVTALKVMRPGSHPRSTLEIVTSYFDASPSTILSFTRLYGNVSCSANTNVTSASTT